MTNGNIALGVGLELYDMNEGDFAIVFPNVIHHYQVFGERENKVVFLHIDPAVLSGYLKELQTYSPENPVLKKKSMHPDVVHAINFLTKNPECNSILAQAYAQIIIAYVFTDMPMIDKKSLGSDDLIYNSVEYIAKNFRKSTHNRRERPVCGHRGRSRGPFYYRITTFGKGPWDARDPHKTTFMALKHVIRLSIWQRQKETPGVEKAPGVSSPQRKESGRSGRDDGELRFGYDPAIHARRLRVYHRPRRLRMASRISIFFAARRFEPLNSMG